MFRYDADYDRTVSELYNNGNLEETRIYAPEGIEIHTRGNTERMIHYVAGPDGICAILYSEGAQGDEYRQVHTYYPYTDHLGSIWELTDEYGSVIYEQNFDAWGRYRDPATWSYNTSPIQGFEWLRGFTGHEHMPQFGLINMNARLYDPLIGRMLSPDNYLSNAYSTQAYNRYSYAHNNPLSYIDPDGNNPLIVAMAVGAIISASSYTLSVASSQGGFSNWNWLNFAGSAVTGAVSGAFTWGIGNAFSPLANVCINPSAVPSAGLANEAARGLMHGYVGLVTTGETSSFVAGALGSFSSSIGEAVAPNTLGTFGGGLVFAAATGGGGALMTGGKFWQGALIGVDGYLLNQSMHVVKYSRLVNHGGGGNPLRLLGLLQHYTGRSGMDYIISDEDFKELITELQEKNGIDKNNFKPVKGHPGLYVMDVSTYGTSFENSAGSIKLYANEKGIVGYSDWWNFERQSTGSRSGWAETKTIIGSSIPGVPFWVLYGLTPFTNEIQKH